MVGHGIIENSDSRNRGQVVFYEFLDKKNKISDFNETAENLFSTFLTWLTFFHTPILTCLTIKKESHIYNDVLECGCVCV